MSDLSDMLRNATMTLVDLKFKKGDITGLKEEVSFLLEQIVRLENSNKLLGEENLRLTTELASVKSAATQFEGSVVS